MASIEDKCEHVKLASMTHYPFCSVDSLRKASRAVRIIGKRICLFLWEHEGIENFIRGQTRIRSLEVGILIEMLCGISFVIRL